MLVQLYFGPRLVELAGVFGELADAQCNNTTSSVRGGALREVRMAHPTVKFEWSVGDVALQGFGVLCSTLDRSPNMRLRASKVAQAAPAIRRQSVASDKESWHRPHSRQESAPGEVRGKGCNAYESCIAQSVCRSGPSVAWASRSCSDPDRSSQPVCRA